MKKSYLSETTLNKMSAYPDILPNAMYYRELLVSACIKFRCSMDEARDKYGTLTNSEWFNLLYN